jgi:hypothetical protein
MKGLHKQFFKYAVSVLAVVVLLLIVFAMWLYGGKLTPLKTKVFTKLPIPIASVNGDALYLNDFAVRLRVYQQLYSNKSTNVDLETAKKEIFSQMVLDSEIKQLANQNGLSVDSKELEAFVAKQNDLDSQLQVYGMTKNQYLQLVVRPQLLRVKLQIWFNSQEKLNAKQFAQAQSLVDQIKSGQDMSSLAMQFTQEPVGKIVGGDLGFVDPVDLVYEMREPVYALSVGEVSIIPGRVGLNIIKLEEKQSNKFHLRQILLSPENFESWLETQTKKFKTYKLINF